MVRNSQDSWQRPPHEAPPWGGAASAFATLHPPWPGARVPSYSCPAASWTEQGFVSSDCWWDRRRELSQVLTEAFLPPRLHRVTSRSPTMGQAYRQPATRGIVATNFAAHAFFIVPFFSSRYFKSMAQCTGARPKSPLGGATTAVPSRPMFWRLRQHLVWLAFLPQFSFVVSQVE